MCIFGGAEGYQSTRTVVPLRVGAKQGPASSPWCDVGVASTLTSEKRHDLSFGGKKGGVGHY